MRRLLRVLLRIVAVVAALVLVFFAIRFVNGLVFGTKPAADPTNLALYPTDQPGMKVEHVTGKYLNGFHLVPDQIKHKGVVVSFGGSDGGPGWERALLLAQQGYEVLGLFFFGMPNQQRLLSGVPLEFFGEAIDYLDAHAKSPRPLTVIGISKGSELSLVLANHYPRIDNLVLYTPSRYVYQGLDYAQAASSWTFGGAELPYVNFRYASAGATASMMAALTFNYPARLRDTFVTATAADPNAAAAKIGLDKLKGHLLMFAGDEDAMWPGEVAAREIAAARPNLTEAVVYEGAGHLFFTGPVAGPYDVGGSVQANGSAEAASQAKLLATLAAWHK